MIIKLQILYDDLNQRGERGRDEVFRAIDGAMHNPIWAANGEGWTVTE